MKRLFLILTIFLYSVIGFSQLINDAVLIQKPSGYKAGTLYSVIPNTAAGDFDVTRNCTATRINSDGLLESMGVDVPLLNYDEVDGEPYLLTQPQRTNLITYPVSFGNSYWTKSGATIDDNGGAGYAAPHADTEFATSAFKLVESAVSEPHLIRHNFTTPASTDYSYSINIKYSGRQWIYFNQQGLDYAYIFFDVLNGEVGTINNGATTTYSNAKVKELANGYYNISFVVNTTFSVYYNYIQFSEGDANVTTYLGDGTSGVYIFGAQLEEGSYPTTTILPATVSAEGSTVTRLADAITPLSITPTSSGAILYNNYVQNFTTTTPSKAIIASNTKIYALFNRELTSSEITELGATESSFITSLIKEGEFSMTVSGTGTCYYGDGESDVYDGTDIGLTHTYLETPEPIVFVGTLTKFYISTSGSNAFHDIASLPSGLTTYSNHGSNTTSGDIASLPSGLTTYYNSGSNTTSGDIASLPSGLTYYRNLGFNRVDTYTSGHTFNSSMNYFEHLPAAGYGLDSTEVDNLLIDLDSSGMSSGTITLSGNNAARTSASDAAVTSLQGKGVSVTTN